MRILFICGSLEPGKDGVGDYTRRLAGELKRQGVDAAMIAINDRQIPFSEKHELQYDLDEEISVTRLPASQPWKIRLQKAEQLVNQFDPEWLSLQFVPFAFHNKGLPLKLPSFLKKIGKDRQWHIMFHELWVGMDENSGTKMKMWGWVQKRIISNLVYKLNTKKIHTHAGLYLKFLEQMGFPVKQLPLFGNIYHRDNGAEFSSMMDERDINIFVFATIYSGSPINPFMNWLIQVSKSSAKKMMFHFIGENGSLIKDWITSLEQVGIEYKVWGRKPAEVVLQVLQQSSFGLTTTPFYLAEKSGSAAAMAEYGLPVLCVAGEWRPRGLKNLNSIAPGNIIQWQHQLKLSDIFDRKGNTIDLKKITKKFTSDLLDPGVSAIVE